MLDEKALRREGFDQANSVPIVLSDGQEWWFPKPRIVLFPIVGDDGSIQAGGRPSFGPEYDGLMEAVRDPGDGPLDQITAVMRVAVFLLRRNYDLKPEHFARLMVYRSGDDDNRAMWQAIVDVSLGNDSPKPTGDGSASSSSPTASTPTG